MENIFMSMVIIGSVSLVFTVFCLIEMLVEKVQGALGGRHAADC